MRASAPLAGLTPRIRLAAVLTLGGGLLCAGYLLTDRFGTGGLVLLLLHGVLPLIALPVLLCAVRGPHRRFGMLLALLTLLGGLIALFPAARELRGIGVHAHAVLGLLAAGTAAAAWVRSLPLAGGRSRLAVGLFLLCVTPALAVYAAVEHHRSNWKPPAYDPAACYRFLTATTVEQAGEPNFPSALRVMGDAGTCLTAGCHEGVHAEWRNDAHARAGTSRAYTATYADFVRRRGQAASRWCQGCHNPESQRGPTGSGSGGVGCLSCHGVTDVHALYGSAALVLDGGGVGPMEPRLRPEGHAHRNLRGGLQASAEFCGACHRKNWSLPQNAFHWMPGPDEYGQWLSGPYSGAALLSGGEAKPAKSCTACHDPHGARLPRANPVQLHLFIRYPSGFALPAEHVRDLEPGWVAELDVAVQNSGIGHDFPYGMPDLYEAWLAVEGLDAQGKVLVKSGDPGAGTAAYTLQATDAAGRIVTHGDLDRMTAVREWRRISSGQSDLVRYRFKVPSGLASFKVRMLRRRRPEFSRWAGEPVRMRPEVVAEAGADLRLRVIPGTPQSLLPALRSYGMALARARLYPQAIQVLKRALEHVPGDGEALLALGQVFMQEGDLLAAEERFREAERYVPDRARAWQAVVARRSGRLEAAVRLLEPLVKRFPRDTRLRFELGRALMELLRHREAVTQFEALLQADPLDVAGHHNLMQCWQRLNRPAEARREEALYKLLAPLEEAEAPPLRVFTLERVP